MSEAPSIVRNARIASATLPPASTVSSYAARAVVSHTQVVLEGADLSGRLLAVLGKEHVVVGVRVERRVEVDEIDRLVADVTPQHVEVVAVVEDIPLGHGTSLAASARPLPTLPL